MGVDWYTCESCEETFPDCGDYVYCEGCGRHWCSDDCAESDGYECPQDEEDEDIIEESTCGFCRGEQFGDSEILALALEMLRVTKDELIEILAERKK